MHYEQYPDAQAASNHARSHLQRSSANDTDRKESNVHCYSMGLPNPRRKSITITHPQKAPPSEGLFRMSHI